MVSLDMGGGHNVLYSTSLEECLTNIVCLGVIGFAACIGAYHGMLMCKHRYIHAQTYPSLTFTLGCSSCTVSFTFQSSSPHSGLCCTPLPVTLCMLQCTFPQLCQHSFHLTLSVTCHPDV